MGLKRIVWLLTLAFVFFAVSAHAQWDPKKQFEEGLSLYDKGDFQAAIPFFENVYTRTQSPNARLYYARCLHKLGQNADAYREMQGTVDLAGQTPEKYADTRDTAAAELAQLEPLVGKVIVAFSDTYHGAEAIVGGRTIDPDEYGAPLIVEPGEIEVSASAPGKLEFSTAVVVDGGETKTVAIALEDDLGDAPGGETGGGALSTVQWIGVGVAAAGVGSLVVFGVFGAQASDKFEEVETGCQMERCVTSEYNDTIDDGKKAQTIANVTLTVGIVLGVAGAAMIIFGGDSDNSDSDSDSDDDLTASAVVVPLPGGAAMAVSGTF